MNTVDKMRYAVGIDLGGTFVKFALVSESGDILLEDKLPIGAKASKNDILDTIKSAIQILLNKANEQGVNVIGIGIGSPGIVCDGIVLGGADNLKGWENSNLSSY